MAIEDGLDGTGVSSEKTNGHIVGNGALIEKPEVWKTEGSKTCVDVQVPSPVVAVNAKVRLPLRQRATYSIGHVYNDLCASMWFTYLLMYYNLVLGFSNSQAGLLILIGQVADALATPFVGLASDKQHSMKICRYGRRKIWHLIGTVCVTVSFPFLFIHCLGCEYTRHSIQMIYFASFIILFQFGWAAVQVSHLSLIPDLSSNPSERTELGAYRNAFTVISSILVYGIAWGVLGSSDDSQIGPDSEKLFRNIVLIVTGIGVVFSVAFHIGVIEPRRPSKITPLQSIGQSGEMNGSCALGSEELSIQQTAVKMMTWKKWLKDLEFYKVAVLYMCTRLFVNLSQTYISLYLQESLDLPKESVAYIPLVVYVSGFVASMCMKKLNKVAGRLISFVIGGVFGLAFCAWVFFGDGDSYAHNQIYGVAIFMGVGGSVMLVTCLAITADLIGDQVQSGAFVYGAMSFADKLSNGIVVVVVQNIYVQKDSFYRDVLAIGCSVPAVIALIAVCTVKKPTTSPPPGDRSTETDTESNGATTRANDQTNSVATYVKHEHDYEHH